MTKTCQVCSNPKTYNIETEYVQGRSLRNISEKYGLPYAAVRNHTQNHISRQMVQAYSKKDMDHQMNLFEQISEIVEKAKRIFDRNYDKKRDGLALKALDSQRNTYELLCKLAAHYEQAKEKELQAQQEENENEDQELVKYALENLTDDELTVYLQIQEKLAMSHTEAKHFDCFKIGSRKINISLSDLDEDQIVNAEFVPDNMPKEKRQPNVKAKESNDKPKMVRTKPTKKNINDVPSRYEIEIPYTKSNRYFKK